MVQIVKDTKYSWLVMAASLVSMFLAGALTYGSISVLAYVWADMYDLDADVAAWAPSVMGATFQLTGQHSYYLYCIVLYCMILIAE